MGRMVFIVLVVAFFLIGCCSVLPPPLELNSSNQTSSTSDNTVNQSNLDNGSNNPSLFKECAFYWTDTSIDYNLTYGVNGTVSHTAMKYIIPYPENTHYTYELNPNKDSVTSEITIDNYTRGNRFIKWIIGNFDTGNPYIYSDLRISMSGTQKLQVFQNKWMSIDDAAKEQPLYLGSQTMLASQDNAKIMIDPDNDEIRSIAENVKMSTGSKDTWTVAAALFLWLKNNTVYYDNTKGDGHDYTKSALEVLHSGKGRCTELSYLYVSLLRSVGIPARFVNGYSIGGGPPEKAGHTWVEFYDGEWVTVEVSGDQNWQFFGIRDPDKIQNFVDDGTDNSTDLGGSMAQVFPYGDSNHTTSLFYMDQNMTSYHPMYLKICQNGTRELTDKIG